MLRDPLLFLEEIVASCEKILRFTDGKTFEQFRSNEETFDAVCRNLELIGEGVKHVPEDLRARHPAIDWRRVAGLRDVLAHGSPSSRRCSGRLSRGTYPNSWRPSPLSSLQNGRVPDPNPVGSCGATRRDPCRCAPEQRLTSRAGQPLSTMLQQVTAPSALASSETSTVTRRMPARSSRAAVRGNASG